MAQTVFFSWQSDRPPKTCRNFIEAALSEALKKLSDDVNVEDAVRNLEVDKDMKGVPGSPSVLTTILSKIDKCAVFVGDLTFCGTRCDNARQSPNPNVLLEYGWALKSIGEHQVIGIMNEAYGAVAENNVPFDLAHARWPIRYTLKEGASDQQRERKREELAVELAEAIRTILTSDKFRAKQPRPELFPARTPADGTLSRFRAVGTPLAISPNQLGRFLNQYRNEQIEDKKVFLQEGPSIWLRVMPKYDPKRLWRKVEIKKQSLKLVSLPLMQFLPGEIGGNIPPLSGDDGCGHCIVLNEDAETLVAASAVYVFTSGEIWLVNVWSKHHNGYVYFDEQSFTKTLSGLISFLDELGAKRPYHWIAGIEGVKGVKFTTTPHFNRILGVSSSAVIQDSGDFDNENQLPGILERFFDLVYDACDQDRHKVGSGR